MSIEIEPSHVFGLLIGVTTGLFAFMLKINRCIGRIEGILETHIDKVK